MDVLEWLPWLLVAVLSVVAFRATVRFDLNEWLRDRRERKETNLRMLCPHVRYVNDNGKLALRSSYISPMGTMGYQCQACGNVTHDRAEIEEGIKYWAANPKEYLKLQKVIEKRAKKLGRYVD